MSTASLSNPPKLRRLNPFQKSHHERDNSNSAVYWLRDLVPVTVPNARVLTYDYDTHLRHCLGPPMSSNTVYDIAWDCLVALEAESRQRLRDQCYSLHIAWEELSLRKSCDVRVAAIQANHISVESSTLQSESCSLVRLMAVLILAAFFNMLQRRLSMLSGFPSMNRCVLGERSHILHTPSPQYRCGIRGF
jgi:hypothetical protein